MRTICMYVSCWTNKKYDKTCKTNTHEGDKQQNIAFTEQTDKIPSLLFFNVVRLYRKMHFCGGIGYGSTGSDCQKHCLLEWITFQWNCSNVQSLRHQCRMNLQDYENKKLKWLLDLELVSSPGATGFTVNAIFNTFVLFWIASPLLSCWSNNKSPFKSVYFLLEVTSESQYITLVIIWNCK